MTNEPGLPTRDSCCPRCGSLDLTRSRRRAWDYPPSWFGLLPYRCLCCLARFHRRRRNGPGSRPSELQT